MAEILSQPAIVGHLRESERALNSAVEMQRELGESEIRTDADVQSLRESRDFWMQVSEQRRALASTLMQAQAHFNREQ